MNLQEVIRNPFTPDKKVVDVRRQILPLIHFIDKDETVKLKLKKLLLSLSAPEMLTLLFSNVEELEDGLYTFKDGKKQHIIKRGTLDFWKQNYRSIIQKASIRNLKNINGGTFETLRAHILIHVQPHVSIKTEQTILEYKTPKKPKARPKKTLWFNHPALWKNDLDFSRAGHKLWQEEEEGVYYATDETGEMCHGAWYPKRNAGVTFATPRPKHTLVHPRRKLKPYVPPPPEPAHS